MKTQWNAGPPVGECGPESRWHWGNNRGTVEPAHCKRNSGRDEGADTSRGDTHDEEQQTQTLTTQVQQARTTTHRSASAVDATIPPSFPRPMVFCPLQSTSTATRALLLPVSPPPPVPRPALWLCGSLIPVSLPLLLSMLGPRESPPAPSACAQQLMPHTVVSGPLTLARKGSMRTHSREKMDAKRMDHTTTMVGVRFWRPMSPFRKG